MLCNLDASLKNAIKQTGTSFLQNQLISFRMLPHQSIDAFDWRLNETSRRRLTVVTTLTDRWLKWWNARRSIDDNLLSGGDLHIFFNERFSIPLEKHPQIYYKTYPNLDQLRDSWFKKKYLLPITFVRFRIRNKSRSDEVTLTNNT